MSRLTPTTIVTKSIAIGSSASELPSGCYYIKILNYRPTSKSIVEICASKTLPIDDSMYMVGVEALSKGLGISITKAIEKSYVLHCKLIQSPYRWRGEIKHKKQWSLMDDKIYNDQGKVVGQLHTHLQNDDNNSGAYCNSDKINSNIDWEEETYYALGGEDYSRFCKNGGDIDDLMDSHGL